MTPRASPWRRCVLWTPRPSRAKNTPTPSSPSTASACGLNPPPPLTSDPMNPYSNLPLAQRATQRLVEQFNADERLWKKLGPRRKARRKLRPRLSRKKLKKLDLSEFAKARPPQDCIGQWIETSMAADPISA